MMNQPIARASAKKTSTGLIVGIIIGVLLIGIVIWGILSALVSTGLSNSRGKAKDTRIRSSISQLRTVAEIYKSDRSTYIGFTTTDDYEKVRQDVEAYGSSIVTQNISQDAYLIYAKLPASGDMICVDATGNAIKLKSISPNQTTCK